MSPTERRLSRLSRLAQIHRERCVAYCGTITLALLVRVYASFFAGKEWFSTDTFEYFSLADAILARRPFSYTPNGYPLLIAVVKLAAKPSWVPAILICVNIVSSATVVILVMRIAEAVHPSPIVRYSAGLLCALLPSQINYVRYLYSEAPATVVFVGGIALLLVERHTTAGFLLYVSNLFRSTLGPVIPLACICVIAFRRTWRAAILLAAGGLVGVMLYWPLEVTGIVHPPGNFAANVLLAIGEDAEAWSLSGGDDLSRSVTVISRYIAFARDHPREFVRQRLTAAWNLWGPWPPAGDTPGRRPRSTATRLMIGLRFPLLILAIVGFVRSRRLFPAWICAVPIAVISVTHFLLYAEARYTYPVEPLAVVLAAVGGYSLVRDVVGSRNSSGDGRQASSPT